MDRRDSNISAQGGSDGDFMQTAIRHHMLTILHPVMEQVRDLQGNVHKIKDDLACANSKASTNKAKVDHHEQELTSFRHVTAKMNALLDKLQIDMRVANDERAKLAADHDTTKKIMNETTDLQSNMGETVKELCSKTMELDGQVRSLTLGLWKADKNISSNLENLDRLKGTYQELHDEHNACNKDLQQLTRYTEETARSLQMVLKTVEHHKEDQVQSFKRVDEHLNHLEKQNLTTTRDMQQLGDALKSTNSDIQQLRVGFEHENGRSNSFEQMKEKQAEAMELLKGHSKHLTRLDVGLDRLGNSFSTEKQSTAKTTTEVQGRLDSNAHDIQTLGKIAQRHTEELKLHAHNHEENDAASKKLEEQVDASANEVRHLLTWQKAAANAIEMSSLDHQKTHDEVGTHAKHLKALQDTVKNLVQDTTKMNDTLGVLGKRFDKSMQGLSKGFQDTFKHVAMPPDAALPAIKTPRPRSGHSVSPKIGVNGSALGG